MNLSNKMIFSFKQLSLLFCFHLISAETIEITSSQALMDNSSNVTVALLLFDSEIRVVFNDYVETKKLNLRIDDLPFFSQTTCTIIKNIFLKLSISRDQEYSQAANIVSENGAPFRVLLRIGKFYLGKDLYFFIQIIDMSYELVLQRLNDSYKSLQDLIDNFEDSVSIVSGKDVIYKNQKAWMLFGPHMGFMSEEHMKQIIHPDDLELLKQKYSEGPKKEKDIFEYRIISNGKVIDVRSIGYPILYQGKEATIYILQDITALVETREMIKAILGKVVSPKVAEKLINQQPEYLKKGERIDAAVMFCDITDFTTISENYPPEVVTKFLNEYLTRICSIVEKNGGLVDKFIGDCALVIFSNQIKGVRASGGIQEQAVKTAFNIIEHVRDIKLPDGQPLDSKIGINSGSIIAGTIGSNTRYEYTVIGDVVNTASRIEGQCRNLKHGILISDNIYNKLSKDVKEKFNDLGKYSLKGKKGTIQLFGAFPRK